VASRTRGRRRQSGRAVPDSRRCDATRPTVACADRCWSSSDCSTPSRDASPTLPPSARRVAPSGRSRRRAVTDNRRSTRPVRRWPPRALASGRVQARPRPTRRPSRRRTPSAGATRVARPTVRTRPAGPGAIGWACPTAVRSPCRPRRLDARVTRHSSILQFQNDKNKDYDCRSIPAASRWGDVDSRPSTFDPCPPSEKIRDSFS
jgi:hypothetical protein